MIHSPKFMPVYVAFKNVTYPIHPSFALDENIRVGKFSSLFSHLLLQAKNALDCSQYGREIGISYTYVFPREEICGCSTYSSI